jgi:predicted TIM-barrel fold metal-dependent hydrolase
MICDAHIHFFSPGFFALLGIQLQGTQLPQAGHDFIRDNLAQPGIDRTESPDPLDALADRWIGELDNHHVARAALIASLPNDEMSVAAAVARHPTRFVGFFMVNPLAADALARVRAALDAGMRGICLFPAMHRYSLHDERVAHVFAIAASHRAGPSLFVHCGVLSVGVRKKYGLPSAFEIRFGNPLDVQELAYAYPTLPIIIPHFGAGLFREALMAAETCSNIYLDTSSSNSWMRYTPGLTLPQVFRTAIDVVGADRLLFGTDSSFFPRGWNRQIYDVQQQAAGDALVPPDARAKIFGGNFQRLFPV